MLRGTEKTVLPKGSKTLDGYFTVSNKIQLLLLFFKKYLPARQKVYFEGRFISERRYLNVLAKRYLTMLKKIKPGQEYPTWE